MDTKEKNARIILLSNQGISCSAIAREFSLTGSRIHQIIERNKREKEIEQIEEELLKQIKKSDDMDRQWPLTDLIYAWRLSLRTRERLFLYFACQNQKTAS